MKIRRPRIQYCKVINVLSELYDLDKKIVSNVYNRFKKDISMTNNHLKLIHNSPHLIARYL